MPSPIHSVLSEPTHAAPLRKVTLRMGPADWAYIRFAYSPLWECVAAFRAWMDPGRHALLLPWITRIKTAVSHMDWEPLTTLAMAPRGAIPDFLAPPPTTPLPEINDELSSLRNVSADVVRAEIEIARRGDLPHDLQMALKQPTALLKRLALCWRNSDNAPFLRSGDCFVPVWRARCCCGPGLWQWAAWRNCSMRCTAISAIAAGI